MVTRRRFIQGVSGLALAPTVPGFLAESVRATAPDRDGRVLVVLQLSGGNDGINTVVPFSDDAYRKHRKRLSLPQDELLRLNDSFAFHPAMTAAARLFEQKRLAVFNAVGYPNPNRSHDVSMAIWHSARFDKEQHDTYGWLGRAFDESKARRRGPESILVGDDPTPLALRGRRAVTVSVDSLKMFAESRLATRTTQGKAANTNGKLDSFLERQLVEASTTAGQLRDLARKSSEQRSYPNTQIARRMQLVSQLIQADLGTRVFYTVQPGYDTHSQQVSTHHRLLSQLSGALEAFLNDMRDAKLENRVVVLCFSEFGRRVAENASAGTDHGTAGPVFLAGNSVKPGLHGDMPGLDDLDNGDLQYQIDFRGIYAAILRDWLGLPSSDAMGAMKPMTLFA